MTVYLQEYAVSLPKQAKLGKPLSNKDEGFSTAAWMQPPSPNLPWPALPSTSPRPCAVKAEVHTTGGNICRLRREFCDPLYPSTKGCKQSTNKDGIILCKRTQLNSLRWRMLGSEVSQSLTTQAFCCLWGDPKCYYTYYRKYKHRKHNDVIS